MDILCFGGEDWWYHNRAHIDMQLMRRFAKKYTTLYINSVVMQKPGLHGSGRLSVKLVRKTKSILKGLKKSEAGFWVYSPFCLPVNHIHWAKPLNVKLLAAQIAFVISRLKITEPVVWVACPAAADIALRLSRSKLVYQRTDRYEEFPNVDAETIKQQDLRLKSAADLTVFVNRKLYEQESSTCKKALYLDHGVDYEMFASAERDQNVPADIAQIPRPIIGFFGEIEEFTVDVPFLEKVADCLPDKSFVLVGRILAQATALKARKNVWALGQKPYELVPLYGKCFDVAIMPWRNNSWIEACNPVKLKEYLALGLPIVSTPFPELLKYRDVVYQALTPTDFAHCIEQAISENNPELVAKRRERVRSSSWDSKAELVLQELFEDSQHVL